MTAENPDHLDARKWMKNRTRDLDPLRQDRRNGPKYRWTIEDFKLSWLLRDQFTHAELMAILEIATGKRYDNRKGIDTFVTMLATYIDQIGD